jgi:hypothetical protein
MYFEEQPSGPRADVEQPPGASSRHKELGDLPVLGPDWFIVHKAVIKPPAQARETGEAFFSKSAHWISNSGGTCIRDARPLHAGLQRPGIRQQIVWAGIFNSASPLTVTQRSTT